MTLAGWLYRSYADERSAREADLLNQARFNVLKIALNINGSLNQLVDTNRRLASDLTNGKLTGAGNIEARLELETGKNPSIQAIGVAYEPYAFSAEQYLYAPYYVCDHLEHNYGHGKQYLAAILVMLNLLAFLLHTILDLTDRHYQLIRQELGTRKTFFQDIQALTRYLYFDSWQSLLSFMFQQLELELPPPGQRQILRRGSAHVYL